MTCSHGVSNISRKISHAFQQTFFTISTTRKRDVYFLKLMTTKAHFEPFAPLLMDGANHHHLDLMCVTEHINLEPTQSTQDSSRHLIRIGESQAYRRPLRKLTPRSTGASGDFHVINHQADTTIVIWETTHVRGSNEFRSRRFSYWYPPMGPENEIPGSFPLIFLVNGSDTPISDKIVRYYSTSAHEISRWDRLAAVPECIYLDMDFLFTKWDKVWEAVKKNVQDRVSVSKYFQYPIFVNRND
jgi:hypothetical protein